MNEQDRELLMLQRTENLIPVGGYAVNAKHEQSSLAISDESVGSLMIFVPFCLTQGCQWSGSLHSDITSARHEGHVHLAKRGVQLSDNPDLDTVASVSTPLAGRAP